LIFEGGQGRVYKAMIGGTMRAVKIYKRSDIESCREEAAFIKTIHDAHRDAEFMHQFVI
jgi:hypothetical protein